MELIAPKTNWTKNDPVNIEDYNRIKNNLLYLHERAQLFYGDFSILDMGSDLADHEPMWDVDVYNAFEKNLEIINQHTFTQDYGITVTFYENGPFIRPEELNRIESATVSIKTVLDNLEAGLRRLPFRLGQYRAPRF